MKSFTMTTTCSACGKSVEVTRKFNDELLDEGDMYVSIITEEIFCSSCEEEVFDREDEKLEKELEEWMPCGIARYVDGCGECGLCKASNFI